MSVATYKRDESKAQFLDNLYKLNISVYGLVSKMPKKMQRILRNLLQLLILFDKTKRWFNEWFRNS